MAYVIAEPCIGTKDNSCVEVCPVDCIHPTPDEPGYDAVEHLHIDPDAVIIIQSDHGSRLSFEWDTPYEEWTDAMLTERFGVLNAIRLPTSCRVRGGHETLN